MYEQTEISQEQINYLIALNKSQCVKLADTTNYEEAIKWCEDNLGERRICHPLVEAEEGYIDYFEGEWATSTQISMFASFIEMSFWFARKSDRMQFALIFG